MKWFKIFTSIGILLLIISESNGTIVLALLLKLMALKGALFLGTPIALGAFMMGQGVGFFSGSLAGGYTVLKAAQKYHEKEKSKWKGGYSSTKGWGWKGQSKPSFGYSKGLAVGNVLASLITYAKDKYKPSYTDYYDEYSTPETHYHHYGEYHTPSHGWTSPSKYTPTPSYGWTPPSKYTPSYPSSHGNPYISYTSYPSTGYGYPSYGYPSSSYSYTSGYPYGGYASPSTYYPHIKPPSLMERIMSKLPSFLGGKQPEIHQYNPYTFMDGSYANTYNQYQTESQDPMNTYYPTNLPGETYTKYTHSTPESEESEKYIFNSKEEPKDETLFEDSEYVYSSSPYAKPKPKLKQNYNSDEDDEYPANVYDGPAKQYTGVMTDIYEAIQKSRLKSYGNPKGRPMGIDEYNPADSTYASSLISRAQRRKDKRPNILLEKFLEEKLEMRAKEVKNSEQRKEAKKLIELLRKAYVQQLMGSATDDAEENADDLEEIVEYDSAQYSEEESPTNSTTEDLTTPTSLTTASIDLNDNSSEFEVAWVQGNRIKREGSDATTQNPLLNFNIEELEQIQLLVTFMEEIKQFFTLVAALDEDTCLQKMVCDVHANKDKDSSTLSPYESNMISTFSIMDTIVPFDPSAPEDSTTKYRLAAKIGSVSGSLDTCSRYYNECKLSTSQIISLGNQVAQSEDQEESQEPKMTSESVRVSVSSSTVRQQKSSKDNYQNMMPKI